MQTDGHLEIVAQQNDSTLHYHSSKAKTMKKKSKTEKGCGEKHNLKQILSYNHIFNIYFVSRGEICYI